MLTLIAVTTFHLSSIDLSMILGVVIPGLTALVTKKLAPGWFQMLILTWLSALAGVVSILVSNNGNFVLSTTLFNMLSAWAIAIAAHYGYQVAGLTAKIQDFISAGIGPVAISPHPLSQEAAGDSIMLTPAQVIAFVVSHQGELLPPVPHGYVLVAVPKDQVESDDKVVGEH